MHVDLSAALSKIEASLQGGMLGVAATFLPTGETVFFKADEIFPTASVIKIAIVSELFAQTAEGRLDLTQKVVVTPENLVPGSGVLALLTPNLALPLFDLALLTLSISDNTASNLCLAAVGGPAAVNARMREWGMTETTIHRPIKFALTPEDPPHTATGTPRDMHTLLVRLTDGTAHSPEVGKKVRNLMGFAKDGDLLSRYLFVNPYAADLKASSPPYVVQQKPGAVTGVRNDAALISRGDATLAVCVYTKGTPDPRWTAANNGSEAVSQVGRLLCEAFFEGEAIK